MRHSIICVIICSFLLTPAFSVGDSLQELTAELTKKDTSFHREEWIEMQKLTSDGEIGSYFGRSISISGDTALIGQAFSEIVYVFIWNGTMWIQEATLMPFEGASGSFGSSVSLYGDTAFIGAPGDDDQGSASGAVYVFTRIGGVWNQHVKLHASDGTTGDFFGRSVSINENSALIGAERDDDNGYNAGSAYIFTRSAETWNQTAKLLASDGASEDFFAHSVSLSDDTALIGAYGNDDYGDFSGSAYIFSCVDGTWTEQQKLIPLDSTEPDWFGWSVCLQDDTALIGARYGTWCKGYAYVFIYTNETWTQQAKLIAPDGEPNDSFGTSVSLDGNRALIGSEYDDDNEIGAGSAYVFNRTGSNWTFQAKLLASDGALNDFFGDTVCLSGGTAFIAAVGDEGESGAVYVFKSQNNPPLPPVITGPSWGVTNTTYTFQVTVLDSDLDAVFIKWDWDDGTNTDWLGPFSSGMSINATHSWAMKGVYKISVTLKDPAGQVSSSEPHVFTVYEMKKAFIFGRYANLTEDNGYITLEAVNLRIIQRKPFQFLHYIHGEKKTFVKDTSRVFRHPLFIIGWIDQVIE